MSESSSLDIGAGRDSAHDSAHADGNTPPSGQLPPVDPELFERAKAAVSALRGRGRLVNGQAGHGNTLALRTGERSTRLLEQPDLSAWHREEVEAITVNLGGKDKLTALKQAVVRETARVTVILASLGDELLEHGVVTGKGKTRSATYVYLRVFDRFVRGCSMLGIEPAQIPVRSLREALEAQARTVDRTEAAE
jgi:hypothetical protein